MLPLPLPLRLPPRLRLYCYGTGPGSGSVSGSEAARPRLSSGGLIRSTLLTPSTSAHSMRGKYRSAVYTFGDAQRLSAERALAALTEANGEDYVTGVIPFAGFRLNGEDLLDYYRTRPDAPFCQTSGQQAVGGVGAITGLGAVHFEYVFGVL